MISMTVFRLDNFNEICYHMKTKKGVDMSIKPPKQKDIYRICAETKSGKIVNIDSEYKENLYYKNEIPYAINEILETYPKIKRENLVIFRQEWVEDKNVLILPKKKKKPTRPRFKHGKYLVKYIQIPYDDRYLVIEDERGEICRFRGHLVTTTGLHSLLFFLDKRDFEEDKRLAKRVANFEANIEKYDEWLNG